MLAFSANLRPVVARKFAFAIGGVLKMKAMAPVSRFMLMS